MSKRSMQERNTARRNCDGEIEASDFGIEKIERESISHSGFGHVILLGELWTSKLEFRSHNSREIAVR